MVDLNLPPYPLKEIVKDGDRFVFDDLRRKYVAFTSEERVRQLFVHFLIEQKHYPQGLLANELSLRLNGKVKRCDSVVYTKTMQPIMIVEYKAPTVKITHKTFEQVLQYNFAFHVDYLVISNGLRHFCCMVNYETNSYKFLSSIPEYEELRKS